MRDSQNNKQMSPKQAMEQFATTVDVLDKSIDSTEANKETAVKDVTRSIAQNAAIKKASTKMYRSRQELDESRLPHYLELYQNADTPAARANAMANVVNIACKAITNEPLDMVLDFFRKHRNDEFLHETVGLQGVVSLQPSIGRKVRLFYTVLRGIANNSYNRRNIQMELIRNVFRSDTFVNWITARLPR